MQNKWFKNEDIGKLILRISIGGLMLFHGYAKVFGDTTFINEMLRNAGLPEILSYGVYVGEILAPIMVLVGYKTRTAAAVYTINMIFTIFLAYLDQIFTVNQYGGWSIELNMLFLLGSLALVFLGGGKYSFDNTPDTEASKPCPEIG